MLMCLNCGTENPDDQKICPGCKTDLSSKKATLDLVDMWPGEVFINSAGNVAVTAPTAESSHTTGASSSMLDTVAFAVPDDIDLGKGIRFAQASLPIEENEKQPEGKKAIATSQSSIVDTDVAGISEESAILSGIRFAMPLPSSDDIGIKPTSSASSIIDVRPSSSRTIPRVDSIDVDASSPSSIVETEACATSQESAILAGLAIPIPSRPDPVTIAPPPPQVATPKENRTMSDDSSIIETEAMATSPDSAILAGFKIPSPKSSQTTRVISSKSPKTTPKSVAGTRPGTVAETSASQSSQTVTAAQSSVVDAETFEHEPMYDESSCITDPSPRDDDDVEEDSQELFEHLRENSSKRKNATIAIIRSYIMREKIKMRNPNKYLTVSLLSIVIGTAGGFVTTRLHLPEMALYGAIMAAVAVSIYASAIFSANLYHSWRLVQCLKDISSGYGDRMPPPGKAVLFLFVPFYNLYWAYKCLGGLPQYLISTGDLSGAPVPITPKLGKITYICFWLACIPPVFLIGLPLLVIMLMVFDRKQVASYNAIIDTLKH